MPVELEADEPVKAVAELKAEDDLVKRRHVMKMLYLLTGFLCLAGGTAQTLLQKWQNVQVVAPFCDGTDPSCTPTYYQGPWWQTELMYLGEHLSFYIYLFNRWWRSRGKDFGPLEVPHTSASLAKPKSPIWWWIIPTCTDMAATVMMNYATEMTRASTVQMLRNFMTVIACMIFVFYLRRPLRYAEWLGALIVTVGLVLTAIYDLQHPEEDTNFNPDMSWLGIVLTLIATCFNGFQLVFEESLCRKFWISPMKAVGLEGFFGLIICGVFLIVCQYTGLEDVKKGLQDVGHSTNLIVSSVFYVICVLFFNFAGLCVSKFGSSIARALIFTMRSVLVWFIELPLGWNTFNGLSCAGMLICVLGVLVYNRVIPIPCWPKAEAWLAKPFGCWGWRWKYDVDGEPICGSMTPFAETEMEIRDGDCLETAMAVAEAKSVLSKSTTSISNSFSSDLIRKKKSIEEKHIIEDL